jgi:catechol 2,3-dioxygenase-like lactoylglutathione lyase family enzyme
MTKVPKGITHIEVTVSDLTRSLYFYRDIIGLREVALNEVSGTIGDEEVMSANKMDRIHEMSDRKWRHAVLRYEGAPDKRFRSGYEQCAIVLFQPYDPPPSGRAIKLDQIGISHFSLLVNGPIEDVERRLIAAGVNVVGWQSSTEQEYPSKSIFVEDPDGILLQLEALPT